MTSRGFTIYELVAALIILGMLAAVGVARYQNLNPGAFTDGDYLKSCIRYAQTRAMADSTNWSFTVNGSTGTFQRSGTAQSFTVSFATSGASTGAVYFDNRGRPTSSFTSSFTVANYPGNPITVDTATGFVP